MATATNEHVVSSAPATNTVTRALLNLVGTTGFEVAGLILWLDFNARGMLGLGLLILFGGLVLERLVVTGIPTKLSDWALIIGSSWWEYAAWALWFILIQHLGFDSLIIIALVLFPGLHFQHAFLVAASVNKTFGELVFNPGFIVFSLIEAIGGALWLAALTATPATESTLPAHLILLVAIAIEHTIQGFVLNSLNRQGAVAQVAKAT